jgi:hypothetical protein
VSPRNERSYTKQGIDREGKTITWMSCKLWRHFCICLTDWHVFSSSRYWNFILTFCWRKKKRNFVEVELHCSHQGDITLLRWGTSRQIHFFWVCLAVLLTCERCTHTELETSFNNNALQTFLVSSDNTLEHDATNLSNNDFCRHVVA